MPLQGLASKEKGVYTREELAPLAEVNVTSLKEYDYFTNGEAGGQKIEFADAKDYWLEFKDSVLILHFTLPVKSPVKGQAANFEIYDPSYFIDFSFDDKDKSGDAGRNAGTVQARCEQARRLDSARQAPERILLQQQSRQQQNRRAIRQQDRGQMSLKKSDAVWFAFGAIALLALLASGIFHEALAQTGPLGIPRPSTPAAPPDGFTGWLLRNKLNIIARCPAASARRKPTAPRSMRCSALPLRMGFFMPRVRATARR